MALCSYGFKHNLSAKIHKNDDFCKFLLPSCDASFNLFGMNCIESNFIIRFAEQTQS